VHKTITSTSWLVQDYWLMFKAHKIRQNNSGLILVVQLHVSVKRLKHKDLSQKTEDMSLLQITGNFIIT